MTTLIQDLKYGLRMLVKTPGFTAVAVLTLALGIGANAAIFTVVNTLLLHPLPQVDTSQVVSIFTKDEKNSTGSQTFLPTSYLNAKDYREMNDVFSGLVITTGAGVTLDIKGNPVPLFCELVNWDYFTVLGAKPGRGRFFLPEEDVKLDANPVAVLSYTLWQKQFGGDPGLVGKTISLNHNSYTVVGIAPKDFDGEFALGGADLWVPMAMHHQIVIGQPLDFFNERRGLGFGMLARLKPGATLERAQSAMQGLARHLEAEYPNENKGRSVMLVPLAQASIDPNFRELFVRAGILLQGIVALVLLIACANVANLMLVRGARRRREMAVRLSMGASRWRIVRQLLTESTVLSVAAGALGVVFAVWTGRLLGAMQTPFVAGVFARIAPDPQVLMVTLGIAVATGLLFGAAPARQASRADLMLSLRDRTDPALRANHWFSLRNVLVVVQVTLSMVALVGAGLFVRSLGNAQRIDPGFETRQLALVPVNLAAAGYDNARAKAFYDQALDRLRALPMVQSASVGVNAPFTGSFERTVFPEGVDPTDRRAGKLTPVDPVSPGYFETMGIPILRGRSFTRDDSETSPMVAVVNQTLANRLWPNQDPLGRHLKFFGQTWNVEVVGVARDSKYTALGEDPLGYVYFPLDQQMSTAAMLFVRTKGDPANAMGSVRSAVQALDPHLVLTGLAVMPEILKDSLGAPRLGAELLGAFGLLALLLAALGVYGVLAYSVSQRTNEFGIRIALGAQSSDVLGLVIRQGMVVVGVGVVVGLALATILTRFLASLLFGLSPHDTLTYAAVGMLLIAVALLASYVPARRATKVDPLVALRHE